MASAWKTIQITDQRGIPLRSGEAINKSYPNFSLSVPRLKLGKIGTLTATNLRFVFTIYQSPVAYELERSSVQSMNTTAYPNRQDIAYIQFTTLDDEEFSLQATTSLANDLCVLFSTTSMGPAHGGKKVVKKIIKRKNLDNKVVGIAAVNQAVGKDISEKDKLLSTGLADIDSLKQSAKELMKIAEGLRKKKDKSAENDLGEIFMALGISDPVTKETAGKNYSSQLAVQFATVMKPVLAKTGGVLSVAEAFCLFNRSLGTNYVSPKDLAEAIENIKRRELGVKVETIEGVTVVILSEKVYSVVIKEMLSKFVDNEFTTPLLVSKQTSLPLSIARNYLLRAESEGTLCRDDSMAGLRFYKNIFSTFQPIDF